MSGEDAVPAEMHRPRRPLGPTPAVLDQDAADRLLTGQLDPADAPPGYAGVARLLAAATAPASPDELAGAAAAAAEFTAAMHSPHSPHSPLVPRSAPMPSKLLSLKATAVAVVAVLSIGGVAAATGLVSVQLVAGHAPTASRGASAAHAERGTAVAVDSRSAGEAALGGLCRAYLAGQGGQNGKREDSSAFRALAAAAGGADKITAFCQSTASATTATGAQGQQATGPDATGAALGGLCRAYLAGQGGQNGKREDSPAFRALAAAAGGADKIAAYCRDTAPGGSATHQQGQGAPSSTGPGQGQGQGQGSPPSTTPGQDQGQGGPPTTTG